MEQSDQKLKHRPSARHALEDVLHSLQDLVRNELADEDGSHPPVSTDPIAPVTKRQIASRATSSSPRNSASVLASLRTLIDEPGGPATVSQPANKPARAPAMADEDFNTYGDISPSVPHADPALDEEADVTRSSDSDDLDATLPDTSLVALSAAALSQDDDHKPFPEDDGQFNLAIDETQSAAASESPETPLEEDLHEPEAITVPIDLEDEELELTALPGDEQTWPEDADAPPPDNQELSGVAQDTAEAPNGILTPDFGGEDGPEATTITLETEESPETDDLLLAALADEDESLSLIDPPASDLADIWDEQTDEDDLALVAGDLSDIPAAEIERDGGATDQSSTPAPAAARGHQTLNPVPAGGMLHHPPTAELGQLELYWDDIPVLEKVASPPPPRQATVPPVAPSELRLPTASRARDVAIRTIARLNIELRKCGERGLDPRTIHRLQHLLCQELEQQASNVDNTPVSNEK